MRKSILVAVLLLLVIGSSSAVACSKAPAAVTLTDDQSREVSIPSNPQRIVSLDAPITEIVFALGLSDRLVGIDDYSNYPKETDNITKLGSALSGFSTETILNQEPDLILTSAGTIVQQLESQSVPVFVLQPKDMAGTYQDIKLVGQITGKKKEADELVDNMTKRVEAVVTKTSALTEDQKPTVYYEVDATNPMSPYTVGSGTFQAELIELAGGSNIASRSGWYPISVEEILYADPDIIILEDYQYGVTPDSVAARSSAWASLTAVKEGHIYPIPDPDLTSRYGPRIVDGLEEIAHIVHPELFPEADQSTS